MTNRVYKLIIFAGIFLLGLSSSVSAQSENDETANVKKRAETFLQTIREEKWDELDKFVAIVTNQIDKKTGKITKIFTFVEDVETKEKVAKQFKRLYTAPKPGKILSVRVSEKDKTIASVEYRHEDRDGFRMVQVNGEWYYMLEYLQ